MALWEPKHCNCYAILIKYILYNKVELDYELIYFINYWKHNGDAPLKIILESILPRIVVTSTSNWYWSCYVRIGSDDIAVLLIELSLINVFDNKSAVFLLQIVPAKSYWVQQ
jgi:hypothetical protein